MCLYRIWGSEAPDPSDVLISVGFSHQGGRLNNLIIALLLQVGVVGEGRGSSTSGNGLGHISAYYGLTKLTVPVNKFIDLLVSANSNGYIISGKICLTVSFI